jgi:Pentapeptide repeats (8 copies)
MVRTLREAEVYGARISATYGRGANAEFLRGAGSLISYVDFRGADLTQAVFDRSVIDNVDFSGGSLNQISANCAILKKINLTAVRLRGARLNGALLEEPTFLSTDFTLAEMQVCPFDETHPGTFDGADLGSTSVPLVQTKSRFNKVAEMRNERDELVNSWPTVSERDPRQVDMLTKKIVELACSNVSIAFGIWGGMQASPRSYNIGSEILEALRAAKSNPQCLGLKDWFTY